MNTTGLSSPSRRAESESKVGSTLQRGGPANTLAANALYVLGAALVLVSAYIHLHLWMNAYRHIPTIGPLFLAQVIAGVAVALLVVVTRKVWAAVIAIGFVASTIGGFLLSVYFGLFGFKEVWSAPFAGVAFAVETSALVVLAVAGFTSLRQRAALSS